MKMAIVSLLAAWTHLAHNWPVQTAGAGLAVALAFLLGVGFLLGHFLRRKETRVATGPLFVLAGLTLLAVTLAWGVTDWILVATGKPMIEEALLLWLAGSKELIVELFRIQESAPLLLPRAVRVPLGLLLASLLYFLIIRLLGSALAEMKSLERKPDDILRRERLEAARKRKEAIAAGLPIPEDAVAHSIPLADDRYGRIYKWLGHWSSVERVENRYVRWQSRTVNTAFSLALLAILPVLMFDDIPVAFWVGSIIALHALGKNLRTPEQPQPAEPQVPEEDDENEPSRTDDTRPKELIDTIEAERGTLSEAPAGPAAHPPDCSVASELPSTTLLAELLRELGVEQLYTHQATAVNAWHDGHNVLLTTPPMSGRRLTTDLLTFYALLSQGQNVLVLTTDRAAARRAEARFNERAERTHWKWNILATNFADRAGRIDPRRSQPALVFSDPESLHREVLAQAELWRTFLAGLGLVVLPELHERAGVVGAHTMHLLRRLRRAVHRSRAVAGGEALLGPDAQDEELQFLATADPLFRDLGRFAERLVGRPFRVVGSSTDGAPVAPQVARVISPAREYAEHLHPALWVRSLARDAGLTAELFGFDDVLTDSEVGERHPLPDAQLIIARASAASYAALSSMTAHLGWKAERLRVSDVGGISDPFILVLWVPDREPFAELLATELPKPTDIGDGGHKLQRRAQLVASGGAGAVQRAHLACTLAENEVTLEDLSRNFTREIIREELERLRAEGRLVERTRRILDAEAGRIRQAHTVTLAGAVQEHRHVNLRVAGPAAHLVDRSTGDQLRSLPAVRALAAAYPGHVFIHRGQRYRVLPISEQDHVPAQPSKGGWSIWCERQDRATLTAPMRRLSIAAVERRTGRDRTAVRDDRRSAPSRNIGGAPFTLQHRDIDVTEEVVGVRRFAPDATPRDSTIYDQPIVVEYRTRAAIMGLPADELGEVSVATLHTLAHLFRIMLPAFVHHAPEDLEVGAIELAGVPSLVFVDTHPGGAGFADAVTTEVIRPIVDWSQRLLTHCPGGCKTSKTGCPRCLDIWRCHAPPEHYQRLDKDGALAVVNQLLGQT